MNGSLSFLLVGFNVNWIFNLSHFFNDKLRILATNALINTISIRALAVEKKNEIISLRIHE
ncbi:hypothetical protein FACS189434_09430 [Bacteroidia bacterium]|nr:hypothetical protein FACS189434_09430 [Bacteroidia bacterium]